jgi:hypothetical protein
MKKELTLRKKTVTQISGTLKVQNQRSSHLKTELVTR